MVFNVMDFGAAGNGVQDDTAAIQSAVNAARAAGGGEVYIPAGTYIVSGEGKASLGVIMMHDNITIYGDGMGVTTVKLKDGSTRDITGIFRNPADVENQNIGLHDLTIDGNRANTSGKVDGFFTGVSPGEPGADRNITVNRVEIMNCSAYGFDPHEQTINLVVTNCVSHGNGLDGFTFDYQVDARIENNVAYDNDRHGFNIVTSSHDMVMKNNDAYGNGGQGIMVQRGSDDIPVPDRILIEGGHIYGNGNDGIQINKADHVTISGVDIHDNGERGIRVMGSIGTIIEDNTISNNSQEKSLAFEQVRVESYDDTSGASGRIYPTSGTIIRDNTITDDGANRANYAIRETMGADDTMVSGNAIYGSGEDKPVLTGANSSFTPFPLDTPMTTDPNAPTILYAPLLGQSNAEMMRLPAANGQSGLSVFEQSLLQKTDFDRVVTMTNMAVGASTVHGDRAPTIDPNKIWWYPLQNRPGNALLEAVEQMQQQIAALKAQGRVTPIVVWSQGEAEANWTASSSSDSGRLVREKQYIDSTLAVFNYIKEHVDPNIEFYLMMTGDFNNRGAAATGYDQVTIDKQDLGLTYIRDAQIKLAMAHDDIHLATNYIDLPMRADVSSSDPDYDPEWQTDAWHLSPASQQKTMERVAEFIALDRGETNMLTSPGPYPLATLADLQVHAGAGKTVTGNTGDNIIVGTTGDDTLNGGAGNDVIIGGGGGDSLNGGAGGDRFYYDASVLSDVQAVQSGALSDVRDTISDFQTSGGDVIDVSALLRAAGYNGTRAVADGYITIAQQGSGTVIGLDTDGAAGSKNSVAIAVLSGVAASAFNTTTNLVTQFPDGKTLSSNSNPVAKADSFTATFNTNLNGNVLVNNGNGTDGDPDGNSLSVTAATKITTGGGSVTLTANGNFVYVPQLGFAGTDSFTYTLSDGKGGTATGAVNISIPAPAGAMLGTSGSNTITGGSHEDLILGLDGNDTLSGGSNHDTIYGGAGNDMLNGNAGNDTLYAVTGNDVVHGNDDNDTLYGGAGFDQLFGDNGNDILVAGTGGSLMTGGKGEDIFRFTGQSAGNHTIADFRTINNDKVEIFLNAYDPQTDNLSSFLRARQEGADTVLSIDRDGAANGASFADLATLQGISDFDVSDMVASGRLVISKTPESDNNHPPVAQDDNFSGTSGKTISGNVLSDNGNGLDSDPDVHVLSVNPFSTTTTAGNVFTLNANGSFTYTSVSSFMGLDHFNYTLRDGHGGMATASVNINVSPQAQSGTVNGTAGDDVISGGSRDDTISALDGNDTVNGGGNNDTIRGGEGNDTLNGNSGSDIIYADAGDDVVHGNDDNDTLYGGLGTDHLYGDNGNDLLVAGAGFTIMTGGGGADTFRFTDAAIRDTITDFRTGIGDKIDVSDVLEGFDAATMAISDFVRAAKVGADTILSVDTDGAENGANFRELALLSGINFDPVAMHDSGNLVG